MIKIVNTIVLISSFTTVTFSACADQLNMGEKKIINLANGESDKDAVNHQQIYKSTVVKVVDENSSKFTSHFFVPTNYLHEVTVEKIGGMACLHGIYENKTGANAVDKTVVGRIPVGYRPSRGLWYGKEFRGQTTGFIISDSDGSIVLEQLGGDVWNSGQLMSMEGICYPVGN